MSGGTFVYDGHPHQATATATGVNGEALAPISITYNRSAEAPTNGGSYDVVATFAAAGNYALKSANATIVIGQAAANLTFGALTFSYDGHLHAANVSATGVNGEALGPITVTYSGQPTAPTHGGSYAVVASCAEKHELRRRLGVVDSDDRSGGTDREGR